MSVDPFLPVALLPEFCKYLPYNETATLSLVSRSVRKWVIEGRKMLTTLSFEDNYCPILHVKKLTTLQNLNLKGCFLKEVAHLSSLVNLENLNLAHNYCGEKGLRSLIHLTNLTHLNLADADIRDDASFISKLTRLTYLNLQGWRCPAFDSFTKLIHLKELNIKSSYFKFLFHQIVKLTQLESLNLSDSYYTPDFSLLDRLKSLTRLSVVRIEFDERGIENIARITQLKFLEIGRFSTTSFNPIPARALSHWTALTRLETLKFVECDWDYISVINTFTTLKYLDVQRSSMKEAPFRDFPNMHLLKRLNLTATELGHRHLFYVGKMISLTSLSIGENAVGNERISHLTDLTNLTFLDVHTCSLSNQGVEMLTSLRNLTHLNLEHNRITLSAVACFSLLQNLQRLNLKNNHIDEQEYPILGQALKRIRLMYGT